jgi:glycosyltransferase involved in cell wall biosynthesis
VSFGASKSPREEAAMRTLRRLHPNYARDVLAFVRADPPRAWRAAVDLARIREGGLPVVLAVLHDRSGGTPRHVRELAQALAGQAVFLVLTPGAHGQALLRWQADEEGLELAFRMPDEFQKLVDVLHGVGVGLVHFHHLIGHHPSVRELPQRLDVPHCFTAHDFHVFCGAITLTGDKDRYLGETAEGLCRCCSADLPAPDGAGRLADWRQANARLLRQARQVLAPSGDAARRIATFEPRARVVVAPHTDLSPDALPSPHPPRVLGADSMLRVVVLGALSAIKGADVLEAAALQAARRGLPIEFHLIGHAYRPLKTLPRARLTIHGAYADRELPQRLASVQPDLVWFPAQWPETYSYTLSAALAAALPVVVPDLGAFPERVRGRAWSWTRPWDSSPDDWLALFCDLRLQHFITGVPPSPEAPAVLGDVPLAAHWDYASDYLAGLEAPGAERLPLPAAELAPHAAGPAATWRSRLLTLAVYLRAHPRLTRLAHAVPAGWRARVSSWLSA